MVRAGCPGATINRILSFARRLPLLTEASFAAYHHAMRIRTLSATAPTGTRLAIRVRGSGPALVLCNGWSTSDFFWKHLLPRWSERHTVVSWDYPGHGASDPAASEADIDIESLGAYVGVVMDAAGIGSAALAGYSMGCQVVLEAAAAQPDRVSAAALLLGSFEHAIATASFRSWGGEVGRVLRGLPPRTCWALHREIYRVMRGPVGIPMGRLLRWVGPQARSADVRDYIEHFGIIHAPSVFAMAAAGQRHSARACLARVRAPVLIVAGEKDVFAPPSLSGALLHQLLPGSELSVLPDGTHTSLFEHHETIAIRVERFLSEPRWQSGHSAGVMHTAKSASAMSLP